MDTVKRAHPYLRKINMILYGLLWFLLILFLIYREDYMIYMACIILGIWRLCWYCYEQRERKQLKYLIQCADDIIDQKSFDIIDGEGELSLLSHKLYILNKRYHTLLSQMHQEQIKLKDYIEDISHQLKTPITSMRLNEELLLENEFKEEHRQKIQHIYSQTLKMNHLVDDLLTLAKLDAHSIEFHFQDYPIELLIEDVEEQLSYLFIQNDVHLHLHHHQEMILCDYEWLEEALKNILKNSIEKNPHSFIDIEVYHYESITKIKIQDHGLGFLQEDLPHIFERFYRGVHKDYQGVGIGLSLAKEIVERHHGIIHAYNQNGAVIEISIPRLFAKKKIDVT